MKSIDLNCDMGESFGAWTMGDDDEIINYVSSVSVACGFHAGDPTTIRKTVENALEKNISIGAHPSYPDLQGFGRREMSLTAREIYDAVLYQIAAVKGICESVGAKMRHVKPHGALYNRAAQNAETAAAIAAAIHSLDANLRVYGLSGSFLISEAEKLGLNAVSEVFADRTYQNDGSLTPRNVANALIVDVSQAVAQVRQMVESQTVKTVENEIIFIKAETVCIHGDGRNAAVFARALRENLTKSGVTINAPLD